MEHAQIADYLLRDARPDDQAQIYHLKAQSVRPYVEKIWGWDEVYQQQDFARDFQAIEHFQVIEVGGNFAGFIQTSFSDPYYEIQELHLLPAYRGKGIGSQILRQIQETCTAREQTIRIGCFRENQRAKALYEKLGFVETSETDTHFILEYPHDFAKESSMNIEAFWSAILRQDANAIQIFFHPDAWVNWHNTNEHFTVEEFIRANCEYPGQWNGKVERKVISGNQIITVTHVYSKDGTISCHAVSFFHVVDGKIASMEEYWGDDSQPPQWRLEKHLGSKIKELFP